MNDMSDHLPMLALLKQIKITDKAPLEFESRDLNEIKINQIKNELYKVNWLSDLYGADSSENFNKFSLIVKETMDKISPVKKVRISSKQKYVESWMTRGLEKSGRKNTDLYKKNGNERFHRLGQREV